ncbi:hypothetical protein BKA64DRAFT_758514 [Cadophora sp. MPI-SDFR-AT-0126]|nr:hypothetical protein BKA64DRAFT_758514 [Leotiomycetes sp. MPI-SDFR-AT-0126]
MNYWTRVKVRSLRFRRPQKKEDLRVVQRLFSNQKILKLDPRPITKKSGNSPLNPFVKLGKTSLARAGVLLIDKSRRSKTEVKIRALRTSIPVRESLVIPLVESSRHLLSSICGSEAKRRGKVKRDHIRYALPANQDEARQRGRVEQQADGFDIVVEDISETAQVRFLLDLFCFLSFRLDNRLVIENPGFALDWEYTTYKQIKERWTNEQVDKYFFSNNRATQQVLEEEFFTGFH